MKRGGKRLLVAPPSMAYGSQGMGSKVPPNSTLVFEMEAVRVSIKAFLLVCHDNMTVSGLKNCLFPV